MIFILYIIFYGILDILLFSENLIQGYSIIHTILFCVSIAAGIIHIILLSVAVYRDAEIKKSGAKRVWTILTVLLGIPIALLYAIFTQKAGKYTDSKEKRKNIVTAVISVLFCFAFAVSGYVFLNQSQKEYNNTYSQYVVSNVKYVNENGENIIYDKMGNSYKYPEKSNELLYYDSLGNTYSYTTDSGILGFKCNETGQFYPSPPEAGFEKDKDYFVYKDILINESGYVSAKRGEDITYYDTGVYYDDEGNLYYDVYLCSWDKDGNLVFPENSIYNEITYEQIISEENME